MNFLYYWNDDFDVDDDLNVVVGGEDDAAAVDVDEKNDGQSIHNLVFVDIHQYH